MPSKIESHAQLVAMMAQFHGRRISDMIALEYAEDLKQFTIAECYSAWVVWRKELRRRDFPMPADLEKIIYPQASDRSIADKLSTQLMTAALKKGREYTWDEKQRDELFDGFGDLGRVVIENRGGWTRFCDAYYSTRDDNTFRSQLRDEIVGTLDLARNNQIDASFALPSKNKAVALVGKLAKEKALPCKHIFEGKPPKCKKCGHVVDSKE